ncbi:unnamed protein product [Effrenium voratum]|nr:unnamed protein product [Effrenium voratum]
MGCGALHVQAEPCVHDEAMSLEHAPRSPAANAEPDAGSAEPDACRWPQRMLKEAEENGWLLYSVFSYLSWADNARILPCVSQDVRGFLRPSEPSAKFWRWLCRCLCQESLLYLPKDEKDLLLLASHNADGCRGLTKEMFALRRRFLQARAAEGEAAPAHFRVSTFCRVRPAKEVPIDGETAFNMLVETPVQLPLNQRVALLQQKNPKLSRAAAMKMLINKQCGNGAPLSEVPDNETNVKNNLIQEKLSQAYKPEDLPTAPGFTASVVNVSSGKAGSVLTCSPGIGLRSWDFQHVFDHGATQPEVYSHSGLRLAVGLLNAQSGALIVYGQTGSGKTHTMFGGESADGLVTAMAQEVLKGMEARRREGFEMSLGASYVEVFGNDITNLLGGEIGVNRGQSQRMGHKYVLEGFCEEPVPDESVFQELLERGNARKRKASTEMNERSTRAHSLVILRLRQRAPGCENFVEAHLSLADLGGSEKVSKSKANENICERALTVGGEEVSRVTWQEYYRCRERITETNHINKGLLTLKRCVQALNERQQLAEKGQAPLPRVPFQDSKLTMLLQPALDGESCTSVVVCCAPENAHAEETVQSLRFGEMCSAVQQSGGAAARDASAAVKSAMQRIDAEIKGLEAAIRQKERWEWRQTKRVDVVQEMGDMVAINKEEEMELGGRGVVEFKADDGSAQKHTAEHEVWGQVLVGAEEENARRDELIKMKLRLLGDE